MRFTLLMSDLRYYLVVLQRLVMQCTLFRPRLFGRVSSLI